MFNRFLANGSPINVRFSQRFQLSPQDLVLRQHAMRICIHHRLRYFTDILQKLSVTGYIGNLQIESSAVSLPNLQDHAISSLLPLFQSRH